MKRKEITMNELVKIENNEIVVNESAVEQIIKFEKLKEEMDLKEKEFKQALKDKMEELGIEKFCINGLSAVVRKATTRTSIDTKKLKEELPDIYEEYSKTTDVNSSIVLTIAD